LLVSLFNAVLLSVLLRARLLRLLAILVRRRYLILDGHDQFPFSMFGMNCSACPVALARLMRERFSEKRVLM